MEHKDIIRLWTSRKNILATPLMQKYHIKESDHMTLKQFIEWADGEGYYDKIQEMTFSCKTKGNADGSVQRIKIYWPAEPKLGGSEYRAISNDMESENLKNAIIIIRDSVTPHAQTTLRYLNSQKIYINVFKMDELQLDIFKHVKVPKHTICTNSEKKDIKKDYNISDSQLPKIKSSDAAIRRLGAVKGNLIKIEEESDTMPGYPIPSYRIVV